METKSFNILGVSSGNTKKEDLAAVSKANFLLFRSGRKEKPQVGASSSLSVIIGFMYMYNIPSGFNWPS